jgi:hypothetical protein
LQNQDSGAFMKIRIIFYNNGVMHTRDNIFSKNIIFSQFIISVCRYLHFIAGNQGDDLCQRFAHKVIIIEQTDAVNGGRN